MMSFHEILMMHFRDMLYIFNKGVVYESFYM